MNKNRGLGLALAACVAMVCLAWPGRPAAQTYNAGQEAARRAAEQAAQERARAAASQLELDRQRQERERADALRRQQNPSTPGPLPGTGPSGNPSAGQPGAAGSAAQPLNLAPDVSGRWKKGSAYRKTVNMNPPAGTGTLGDWKYEVQHDAQGRYAFGTMSSTARDPGNGATLKLTLSCDQRTRVAQERNGVVYGPLSVDVDHRQITQGRLPSGIGLQGKFAALATNLEWDRGGEVSRLQDRLYGNLKLALQSAVGHGAARIVVVEGGAVRNGVFTGGVLKASALISDAGLDKAFEMLAPCWDDDWWDWPSAKVPARVAAPVPQPTPAPAGVAAAGALAAPAPAPRAAPPAAPPPPVSTYALPAAEQQQIPALLATIATPSDVYCSDGLCLGDGPAKVLQYRWDVDPAFDFAELLRKEAAAGMQCGRGRFLNGYRTLADGRRQFVQIDYRPGKSAPFVSRLETEYPGPMTDLERLDFLQREKARWPGLEGEVKTWQTYVHDRSASVYFHLIRSWVDIRDTRKGYATGVQSVLGLSYPGGQILRYVRASQPGCPPGIDWRD